MDQQEKGKDNMHKNLIKVNEMLAFAKNSEGVISLLLKKTKNYSFEDIINKEREIDNLSIVFRKSKEESKNILKDKVSIGSVIIAFVVVLLSIAMTIYLTAMGLSLGGTIIDSLVLSSSFSIIFTPFFLVLFVKACKQYKKDHRSIEEIKENLEKIRESLNAKKEELEKMLDKVDYREYTNKEEIASVLNNMIGITPSNELDNTLNNDLSNTINLDGPTRERKR